MTQTDIFETEGITPVMSKLLAGSLRNKRPYPIEVRESELSADVKEESGILEIAYTEDSLEETTSPDESGSNKNKRTARKCKWYVVYFNVAFILRRCDNFSRGSTNLCARHGGGRRCHCGKLARGPSNLCMKHGGGRRCLLPNCTSAAVYKSDYCRSHGGGKRCAVEGCVASVYSTRENRCFKHGGGKRCAHEGCKKAPVGKTDSCIRHGGGKRCSVDGCGKGAVCEGMCVKHHQDAYKLEVKSETNIPTAPQSTQPSSPASPLRMVQTGIVTIRESEHQ